MSKKIITVFILCLLSFSGYCESQDKMPEEYKEDEFHPILKDLRRMEIIFFGSFPLSLFLSLETYDIYRYFSHDRTQEYLPWPFQTQNVPYTSGESLSVFIGAVSVSFILALCDFIIGKIREAKERTCPDT